MNNNNNNNGPQSKIHDCTHRLSKFSHQPIVGDETKKLDPT